MDALVVDLTHGGVTLALALRDHFERIFAWDIYNTLSAEKRRLLLDGGVKLVNSIPESDKLKIIAPVHCPLNLKVDYTHHEIVNLIMSHDRKLLMTPIIEVTGVKGKTSVVWMLKEILKPEKPLILSSIGVFLSSIGGDRVLKRDISITPASIIETVKLAKGFDYQSCIFELSLGGTGLADVGILTNIAEDYSIAGGRKRASEAKAQIFRSKVTCCEYSTLKRYYNPMGDVNTFSLKAKRKVNLYPTSVNYGLEKTSLTVNVDGLRDIEGETLESSFPVETFAPAPHHLLNVLAAVSGALSLGVNVDQIQEGLQGFKGVEGRGSIREVNGKIVIEEINPGINVKAIEYALRMAISLKDAIVILGGDYGVTCEDIDEKRAAMVLEDFIDELEIVLTSDLGGNIHRKIKNGSIPYIKETDRALQYGLSTPYKYILFIYRSRYPKIDQRGMII